MTLEGQSCRWIATEENQDGAVTGAQWVEVELVDTCRWTGKSMHVRSDGVCCGRRSGRHPKRVFCERGMIWNI